jgi:hypothetical protein
MVSQDYLFVALFIIYAWFMLHWGSGHFLRH